MRALEAAKTYEGKIQFTIVPNTKEGFADEVAGFDMGNHGMVAFDSKGEVASKIGGHSFGETEIVGAITALLAM